MNGEVSNNSNEEMVKDIQGWGVGLIAIGVVSIIWRGFLDPIWGGIIIFIGILSFLIKSRGMYIVFGLMLVIAGIINLLGGGGWMIFGLFQVGLGIAQFIKFGKYA